MKECKELLSRTWGQGEIWRLFIAALVVVQQTVSAAQLLPFQGRLERSNGGGVANGDLVVVQFEIFATQKGPESVWLGETHLLSVNEELINTVLGTKRPLTGIDFSQDLYLQLTVDSNGDGSLSDEDPLLPRQVILPTLFAHKAETAEKIQGYEVAGLLQADPDKPGAAILNGARLAPKSVSENALDDALQQDLANLRKELDEVSALLDATRAGLQFRTLASNLELDANGDAGFDYASRGGKVAFMVSITGRASNLGDGGNKFINFNIRISRPDGNEIASLPIRHWYSFQVRTAAQTFPMAFLEVPATDGAELYQVRIEKDRSGVEGQESLQSTEWVSAFAIEFPDQN